MATMTTPGAAGMQAMYDQWLSMLPQFLAQLGVPTTGAGDSGNGAARALPFPVDQVAKAAALTQKALTSIAQSYAPLLQSAGAPALLAQWASAMPWMAGMQNAGAALPGAFPFAPWLAASQTTPASGTANPLAAANQAFPAAQAALLPLQQMQRAWLDMGNRLAGGTSDTYVMAFERTFGAVSDALGLGPMRKLQAAYGELMNATTAQNESRTAYAMLVQSAFASGWDELLRRLADKAQRGERVDSMLVLIRMWAAATEEAVHGVLQSKAGLDATAAVMRAALAYRRKLQTVAAIVADMLDMATRRELDEAYREIHQLKRELRALRSTPESRARTDAARSGGDARKGAAGKAPSRTRRTRP